MEELRKDILANIRGCHGRVLNIDALKDKPLTTLLAWVHPLQRAGFETQIGL